jgi:hypothetical protein
MEYSKIDWSTCKLPKLPKIGCFSGVRTDSPYPIMLMLGRCEVAILTSAGTWRFIASRLSRDELEWTLAASRAIDAHVAQEEARLKREESHSYMPPGDRARSQQFARR